MLKTLNNMVAQLNKGVSDEVLDQIDNFYQTVDVETLTTYEAIAYNELDWKLWQAYATAYEC